MYLYDNMSKVPINSSIPERYRQFCSVILWRNSITSSYSTQILAYTDCLRRFGDNVDWIVFVDTDEFICLNVDSCISDFVQRISSNRDVHAICMGWTVYGACGQVFRREGSVQERFYGGKVNTYPKHLPSCKCIVRPSSVSMMTAHFPVLKDRRSQQVVNCRGVPIFGYIDEKIYEPSVAEIKHYYTRSLEEWYKKIFIRGSCDPLCIRDYNHFFEINTDMDYISPEDLKKLLMNKDLLR